MIKNSSISSWGVPASKGCSPVFLDPHLRLATAILARACQDAREGVLDAVLWLGSYDAELYCDVLGYEHNRSLMICTDILLDESIPLTEARNEQFEYENA